MIISNTFPPNYDKIIKAIPAVKKQPRIIFTYGDTIHVPLPTNLPTELIKHEELHRDRQAEIGVDEWWNKYLADPEFRFQEELASYRIQYHWAEMYRKDVREAILNDISKHLSGSMYGNICTEKKAKELIKNEN